MAGSKRYRIWCVTEAAHVHEWADTEPSVCPNDGGHTIDTAKTAICDRARQQSTLTFTFQNNGAVLNTGVQNAAYLVAPYKCEITKCQVYGDPSGNIVVDLWKDTYANYPPTDGDSITASAPPTISGGIKSEDTTLTGWTKNLEKDEGILANIDSVANMTWAKVVLTVEQR